MSQHTVGINISVKLQNEDLVFGYRRIVRPGTLDNGPARLECKTGLACYSLVRQAAKRRPYRGVAMYTRAGCLIEYIGPALCVQPAAPSFRSEEHTSELQSLMRTSYAVFCWHNNKN